MGMLTWILLLTSVVASSALAFVSWFIRFSPLAHKLVKRFDRGRKRVPPGLPTVSPWDRLSDLVVRINGLNPGAHTLQGTNCYLVGTGATRVLVDTGEGSEGFLDLLVGVMKQIGCEGLDAILLTHWHADHVGGVNDIRRHFAGCNIPVFKWRGHKGEEFEYDQIENGQIFRTVGATLEAVYTPGHTTDHVSFIVREEQALLTGDMILGCGTAIFDDFTSYMASLRRVLDISQREGRTFTRLYPGHGPVVEEAEEKILFYISHRQDREDQIVKALSRQGGILSSLQITRIVYGKLPLSITVSAHYNVKHHLSKLIHEGRVARGILPSTFSMSKSARDSALSTKANLRRS